MRGTWLLRNSISDFFCSSTQTTLFWWHGWHTFWHSLMALHLQIFVVLFPLVLSMTCQLLSISFHNERSLELGPWHLDALEPIFLHDSQEASHWKHSFLLLCSLYWKFWHICTSTLFYTWGGCLVLISEGFSGTSCPWRNYALVLCLRFPQPCAWIRSG